MKPLRNHSKPQSRLRLRPLRLGRRFLLRDISRLFDLAKPGKHVIEVSRNLAKGEPDEGVKSNKLIVTVVSSSQPPRDTPKLTRLADFGGWVTHSLHRKERDPTLLISFPK